MGVGGNGRHQMSEIMLLILIVFAAAQAKPDEKCLGDDNPGLVDKDVNCSEPMPFVRKDLFQGDIVVDENKDSRNAIISERQKWPKSSDGLVYIPYDDSQASSGAKQAIESAAASYEKHTCIRLKKRQSERDYIRFFAGQGCYSRIGRTGGDQEISLGQGCEYHGTAVHEIMHAIGFLHEQSRPDRDQHIKILWDNIERGMEDQFEKGPSSQFTTLNLAYEHGSVMHYPANAFSKNRRDPTMESIPPGIEMGNRRGFTQLDIQKVNALYGCDGVTPGPTENPGTDGTVRTLPPTRRTLPPVTSGPQACLDRIHPRTCAYRIRRYRGYCRSQGSVYCRQSCGLCTGPPEPPTPDPNPGQGCRDLSPRCVQVIFSDPTFCFGSGIEFCPETCGAC